MSSKKSYKNWNIKGIAESVIKEIKEDREDGEDGTDEDEEEYIERVLDYYLQETYWSIYSRDTNLVLKSCLQQLLSGLCEHF